ncbi:hypothetical protein ACI782_05835 [Geodermatophilus sp. SYSU D00703]
MLIAVAPVVPTTAPSTLLTLQSSAGNSAVSRMLLEQLTAGSLVQREEDSKMSPAHAGGAMGELDAAFALGQKGFEVVIGPGGPEGHKLTSHGFDIVAYNPQTGQSWIVDNKASGGTSTVREATAIINNLKINIDTAITHVKTLPDFPHKQVVLGKLTAARTALGAGRELPDAVSLVVTNAGGYHSGVSKKLAKLGVQFEDMTGAAIRATRRADIKKARQGGVSPGRPTTVDPTPTGGTPGSPAVRPPSREIDVEVPAAPRGGKAKVDVDLADLKLHIPANRVRISAAGVRGAIRAGALTAAKAGLLAILGYFVNKYVYERDMERSLELVQAVGSQQLSERFPEGLALALRKPEETVYGNITYAVSLATNIDATTGEAVAALPAVPPHRVAGFYDTEPFEGELASGRVTYFGGWIEWSIHGSAVPLSDFLEQAPPEVQLAFDRAHADALRAYHRTHPREAPLSHVASTPREDPVRK